MARDRITRLLRVKAGSLQPHPLNWRTHPAAQATALRAAIERLGFIDALIVRETTGGDLQIIDGHLRAGLEPEELVPVLVVDLDEAEAREAIATLDPLAGMAEQDSAILAQLFKILETDEAAVHKLVWPDYVINPLVTADWQPPAVDPSAEEQKMADFGHHVMPKLNADQYAIFVEAIARARASKPGLSDADAITAVCLYYVQAFTPTTAA